MIDVGELLGDPDFCQTNGVQIARRKTEVVDHRNTHTVERLAVPGIITIGKPKNTLMRNESNQHTEFINVYTRGPLLLAGIRNNVSYLADLVLFDGEEYEVTEITNNGQYGFYKSVAVVLGRG